MLHSDTNPRFVMYYPLSANLGLKVVDAGPGFDSIELREHLGESRMNALMDRVVSNSSLFVCGHAAYPDDHEHAGREIHCVYAADLEAFLQSEAR